VSLLLDPASRAIKHSLYVHINRNLSYNNCSKTNKLERMKHMWIYMLHVWMETYMECTTWFT